MANTESDFTRLNIYVGRDNTTDGIHLGIDGEDFDRIHISPQGLVKTGDGTAPPVALTVGATTTVATDPIWDAADDIAVGTGADTAVRVPVPAGRILAKLATGNLKAATPAEILSLLAVYTSAETDTAITTAINNLIAAAPGALDTLNELAAALGNDANFSATVTTALAGKQPLDSDLTAIAALSTTAFGRALLELADAGAGRTAFGLGTAATQASTAFDAAGAAAAAQGASQPLDSDLTAIAALTTTAYGRAFLALADAAAGRTALALGTAATAGSGDFEAAGTAVLKTLYDANTVLSADTDNTPAALTMGASTILARLAAGNIKAATPAEIKTLLAITGADITAAKTVIPVAVTDETTAIVTGTAVLTFRMPFAMTLTEVRASLSTASSSGLPTIDVKESGTTIFSTKITIDATEKTSTTAATPAVLSDTALADDAEITVNIDVAGTGAKGLKLYFIGTR